MRASLRSALCVSLAITEDVAWASGPLPSCHYRVIFRSRPFLTNNGTPRMSIPNYHRSDVMAVESEPPIPVDVNALREDVKSKYPEVALVPHAKYHFHTDHYLAKHLGYDDEFVASLPEVAVESFAGVANPFSLQTLAKGEHVVDVGSGGGFDSFVAVHQVGARRKIVGVDITEEMLAKSRSTASALGLSNVEFREGLAEHLPVEDNWADIVT